MLLPWIIGFSVLGSIGAVTGASAMLLFPEAVRRRIVPALVSYATGTLLGAAFLGMLPAALAQAPARGVMATVLAVFANLRDASQDRHLPAFQRCVSRSPIPQGRHCA